jgi:hypothetical protein
MVRTRDEKEESQDRIFAEDISPSQPVTPPLWFDDRDKLYGGEPFLSKKKFVTLITLHNSNSPHLQIQFELQPPTGY